MAIEFISENVELFVVLYDKVIYHFYRDNTYECNTHQFIQGQKSRWKIVNDKMFFSHANMGQMWRAWDNGSIEALKNEAILIDMLNAWSKVDDIILGNTHG